MDRLLPWIPAFTHLEREDEIVMEGHGLLGLRLQRIKEFARGCHVHFIKHYLFAPLVFNRAHINCRYLIGPIFSSRPGSPASLGEGLIGVGLVLGVDRLAGPHSLLILLVEGYIKLVVVVTILLFVQMDVVLELIVQGT